MVSGMPGSFSVRSDGGFELFEALHFRGLAIAWKVSVEANNLMSHGVRFASAATSSADGGLAG